MSEPIVPVNAQPTNSTPEDNGGQGEKLFTQEQVNQIVSERLARERAKQEPPRVDEREAALIEREKALEAREKQNQCEDYLKEKKVSEKHRALFLDNLDTSDIDRFKSAVDALGDPYRTKTVTVGAQTPHPPANTGGSDPIAQAFRRE